MGVGVSTAGATSFARARVYNETEHTQNIHDTLRARCMKLDQDAPNRGFSPNEPPAARLQCCADGGVG